MSEPLPLVLLHGWGFDSNIWDDIFPELKKSFAVIAIDLPCFANTLSCSSNIDDVVMDLLKQLPPKSILLGWSLGGMIATYIAIHYPQRVAALITVGSNLKWVAVDGEDDRWPGASADNFSAFFENLALNFGGTKQHFCSVIARGDAKEKQLVKLLRNKLSSSSQENFLQALSLLNSIDNRAGFKTLAVPGLHMFGENDAMVPLAVEQGMRIANKQQRTSIIPDTAHAPFLTQPEPFVSMVNDFIQALPYQLDKKRIAKSFSKAASGYDSAAQLQRDVGDRLFSIVPKNKVNPVLDLGCGTGYYGGKLAQQFPSSCILSMDIAQGMLQVARRKFNTITAVCADAEFLPFKDNAIDLVFSNLAIQWCQDSQRLFAELYRVLAPGGQCVISTFQDGTLKELKSAWRAVDELTHVNHFPYAENLCESARKAGFCSIDVQHQRLVQYYATVKELTAELKAIGAHNINSGRPDGLTGKRKLKKMLEAYEQFRCNDKLPAHYEIVFLILKKER